MADALEAVARNGVAALARGEAVSARAAFTMVADAGRATPQLWLLLAQACEAARDPSGQDATLDRLLADDPRNPFALTMKGDLVAAAGDERGAVSFYEFALKNVPDGPLPGDLADRLRRAETAVAASQARFARHLDAALATYAPGDRFAEARDILEGRKSVYLQQPTSLFYPRLPHIQFYPPSDFAWIAALEAAVPAMRAELAAVLADDAGLTPYVEATPGRPNRGHSLLADPRWSAFHLWRDGVVDAVNAARCPATMAALGAAPMPRIAGRSPMALFSVLRPGTHIPPHNGMLNTRLICHIPLIVPGGCRLRVGNEVRAVEPGRAMIFDDSIEHEAWNDSDDTRVVLLFEVWRPELDATERTGLTALFEAIGTY